MGNSREAFTLSVRVSRNPGPSDVSGQVLVALRILVGATSTTGIPRSVSIEGRRHELSPSLQKWYSFLLTPEEIAMSVRKGVLTVTVGPAFDSSSNPIIDSLECFTCDRSRVEPWLPTAFDRIVAHEQLDCQRRRTKRDQVNGPASSLLLSVEAFSRLCPLLSEKRPLGGAERALLQELVQDTALVETPRVLDAVDSILASFDFDKESRDSFKDQAVLAGCAAYIEKCREAISGSDDKWRTLERERYGLKACLCAASAVAKKRPLNYGQAMETFEFSLGTGASEFMAGELLANHSNAELIPLFVHLSLLELAVATGSGSDSDVRGRMRYLSGVRGMLSSGIQSVVALACTTIMDFCERHERPPSDEVGDLFSAQQMVAYYQCDSCGLFPIKDVRYSLLDDARPFDLCHDCYSAARSYIVSLSRAEQQQVLVHGAPVGGDAKLTCAEVENMQPVKIHLGRVVEHEDTVGPSHGGSTGTEFVQRQQLFDDFMELLFTDILSLLSDGLQSDLSHSSLSIIELLVGVVHHSGRNGRKLDRARRLSKELLQGLSQTLHELADEQARFENALGSTGFLSGLAHLIVQDEGAIPYLDGTEKGSDASSCSDMTTVPSCAQHGPGMCRIFTDGPNRGRKFFVCSKDAGSRLLCNFFQWADEPSSGVSLPIFNESIAAMIWQQMCEKTDGALASVQGKLFEHLARRVSKDAKEQSWSQAPLHSTGFCDLADGAFCSRSKIGVLACEELVSPISLRSRASLLRFAFPKRTRASLLHSSLSLLALAASPNGDAVASWSPLLCEVILLSPDSAALSRVAKHALLQLCGRKKSVYAAVRARPPKGQAGQCDEEYSAERPCRTRESSTEWSFMETRRTNCSREAESI